MKHAASTLALMLALGTGTGVDAAPRVRARDAATAKPPAEADLATTLALIQSALDALQPFTLQAEFAAPGESNEIVYVERVPSRVVIDPVRCMLAYVDGRAREPAWSFADIDHVEVQTDVAFHAEIDARNGETRREVSAAPTSYMLKVSMRPGNGWPMHAWGVADSASAKRIADAMTRAALLCRARGDSAPARAGLQ